MNWIIAQAASVGLVAELLLLGLALVAAQRAVGRIAKRRRDVLTARRHARLVCGCRHCRRGVTV